MADMDMFRALSARYGLPLQFVIKEFHVMNVLGKIAAQMTGEPIIFKGGTALNRVYARGLSRFSEDLDFDYIAKKPVRQKMHYLDGAMNIEGYAIEKSRLFRNRPRFDCFFRNEMGKKDAVRAEFNLSFSEAAGAVERRSVVSEISGKTIVGVSVYRLEDLLAMKILALHGRTEGKDIFDLAQFIQSADAALVLKTLGALLRHENSKQRAADVIRECAEKLGALDVKEIKALANNYIPVPLRPDWDELIGTLKMRLDMMDR